MEHLFIQTDPACLLVEERGGNYCAFHCLFAKSATADFLPWGAGSFTSSSEALVGPEEACWSRVLSPDIREDDAELRESTVKSLP